MKEYIYILVLLNILIIINCNKSKLKQLILDEDNNELFGNEKVQESIKQQSSEDICNNLVEIVSQFGTDILQSYKEIKYKDQLLGYNNKYYKQKDNVNEIYMDYMRNMCSFIIKDSEKTFDIEMKNMVMSKLKDCKNDGCQGFDKNKLEVNDKDSFCNSVEYVEKGGQYYDGRDFKQSLDLDNQDTRLYTFMSAEQTQQCKDMVLLFNLCVRVHNILLVKKGTDLCFTNKFPPYSGAKITYYSQSDKQKCADFVLPQFLYTNSQSILVSPESNQYCSQISSYVRKEIQTRIEQLNVKMNEIKFKKQLIINQIESKKELQMKTERIIQDISLSEKEWTKCYGSLQARSQLGIKPSLQIFKIEQLFNLGHKVSLISSEQSFIQAKALDLKDLTFVYYRKINTTLSNTQQICQNIQNLLEKEQDQKIQAIKNNEYYIDEVNIKIQESDISIQQNRFVDSNTDFKQMVHSILQKLKGEQQEVQYSFMNLDAEYDYYKEIVISLTMQKQIILTYAK